MYEEAVSLQPNKVKLKEANDKRDINIFSLTTSNRLTENEVVGGAW